MNYKQYLVKQKIWVIIGICYIENNTLSDWEVSQCSLIAYPTLITAEIKTLLFISYKRLQIVNKFEYFWHTQYKDCIGSQNEFNKHSIYVVAVRQSQIELLCVQEVVTQVI